MTGIYTQPISPITLLGAVEKASTVTWGRHPSGGKPTAICTNSKFYVCNDYGYGYTLAHSNLPVPRLRKVTPREFVDFCAEVYPRDPETPQSVYTEPKDSYAFLKKLETRSNVNWGGMLNNYPPSMFAADKRIYVCKDYGNGDGYSLAWTDNPSNCPNQRHVSEEEFIQFCAKKYPKADESICPDPERLGIWVKNEGTPEAQYLEISWDGAYFQEVIMRPNTDKVEIHRCVVNIGCLPGWERPKPWEPKSKIKTPWDPYGL